MHEFLPVFVFSKRTTVVDVHLDQIFVKGIITTLPAGAGTLKLAGLDVDASSNKTGDYLVRLGLGVEQVLLSLLGKLAVLFLVGQVREPRPYGRVS